MADQRDDFLNSFEVIRPYTPPSKRITPPDWVEPEPEPQDDFFQSFEPIRDVPTVGGYAREAVKEIVKEAPKAAIAAPLKGVGALQSENQRRANETLLFPIMRSAAAKLRDPNTRDEAISELEGYRDSFSLGPFNTYGLNKEQKKALGVAVEKAKAGETDPEKLLSGFEGIEETPVSERAAYKAGSKLEKLLDEKLKRTPGYEDSTALDLAGAIGSTGGSIAQGLVLGPAGMMAASGLQGIDEQLTRAKESGLKDEEAAKFAVQGAGPGAVGALSVEFILRKVPPLVRKKMLKIAVDIAGSGAAEGTVEAVQQVMQNAVEMQYNPDRKIYDGTLYEGVLGGTAGAVLRGVVLGATRGRGVGRGGGNPDPAEVQRELAAEELKIRQREAAEVQKPQEDRAATPEEAAQRGETKVAGEPATITWATGEKVQGTIRKRTANGGYDIVDRDGVVTILDPADLQPDPETGKAVATLETGWKKKKPDSEIEKDLEEFLKADNPWTKVTIEDSDGVRFKAIQGPEDANGRPVFKDSNGHGVTYAPGTMLFKPGWEPDAVETPAPVVGERAKAQPEPLTPEDDASPLPNELILSGKTLLSDADGTSKANTILQQAGIPVVGTRVKYKSDEGEIEAVVQDAGGDNVELLTTAGEIIDGKISKIGPKITQIPVKGTEEARTGAPAKGEETEIELPAFLKPGGRFDPLTESMVEAPTGENVPLGSMQAAPEVTEPRIEAPAGEVVPTERIQASPRAMVGAPGAEEVPVEQLQVSPEANVQAPSTTGIPLPKFLQRRAGTEPVRTEIPEGVITRDNTTGRREGEAGVTEGKDAGDTAEHEGRKAEAAHTGVGDKEGKGTERKKVADPELDEARKSLRDRETVTPSAVQKAVGVRYARAARYAEILNEERKSEDVSKANAKVGKGEESDRRDATSQESKGTTADVGLAGRASTGDEGQGAVAGPARAEKEVIQERKSGSVRQDEGQSKRVRQEAGRQNAQREVSYAQRRGVEGSYDRDEKQGAESRQKNVAEGGKLGPATKTAKAPEITSEAKPQEGETSKVSLWWDSVGETEKRAAIARAGYSEPGIAGTSAKASEQGKQYVAKPWLDLPANVKTRVLLKNSDAIRAYSEKPRVAAKPAPSETKTEVKPLTAREMKVPKKEIPYVKKGDFYVNKDGKGFRTQADALTVSMRLGGKRRGFTVTQDAVTNNRGWVVKEEKPSEVEPDRPLPKPTPETKVEKAAAARKPTKKELDNTKREAVRKQLRDELDRVGLRDVDLSTPDSIAEIEGKKLIEDSKVAVGRTTGNLIEVALSPEGDYRKRLRHESLHSMRNLGLFKDSEWRTLERDAKADKELMQDVKERYAGEALTEEALIEEAIADKFADYVAGDYKPVGFIRAAFEKIKKFLNALGNALRGNGFKTAADIYQSIEAGEVGARPRNVQPIRESKYARERAEQQAEAAINELNDPGAGLVDPDMRSRLVEGDRYFVDDVGLMRKWLISPRTIASLSHYFSPVYMAAKHQFAFRDKIISDLGHAYKPYQDLKRPSKEKVNKVLELGRLEQEVFTPDADGTITVSSSKQTSTMKSGESVTLNPEEVMAYQSVRTMMDKALGIFRDQTVRDFGFDSEKIKSPKDALALINPDTKPSVREKIQTLAKLMTEIQQSERTGYVPFTRFGNVVIVAKRINPNTGQYETLHSETVEVKGLLGRIKKVRAGYDVDRYPEVKAIKAELAKRYNGADIRAFQVASREDTRPDTDRDMLTELLQLPPDEVANAVQRMHTEAVAKGFRRHFFGAKNIPGYSSDIERAIADYVIGLAGFTARRNFHTQWEQSINAIPKNMPKLKQYADKYREYVNSPQEEFAHLRQAGFIYYLAGNPSNAALNLTQVPMVAMPYMGMFDNSARVGMEFGRAYKDALKMVQADKKEPFNPNKAPPDVRAALKKAAAEGQFTPLAMFDIMGVAYNRSHNMRSLSAATRDAVERLAIPQTATEQINRVVTFIAAYRLANRNPEAFRQKAYDILKDNALAADTVLTNFSPEAFARHVVDETQYDVGKINRAVYMRGPGAAVFQFKSFLANTLELHYKLGKFHGNKGKKAVGLMWAGLVATAGLWGIPFSEDIADLTEMLLHWWTGIDADIRTATREAMVELTGSPQIAQLITNGSTRALGLDMTNRIGIGNVVPNDFEEAGGVPLSITIGKVGKALTSIKDGKIGDAAAEMMPLILKNPYDALKWHNKGIRTMNGDPVFTPDEVTAGDVAAKALGWTPSKVAERRAMEWAQQRAGKATQELKTKFYRRMVMAIKEGDYDKLNEIIDEIYAHNDKAMENEQYHKIFEPNDRTLMKRLMAEEVGRGLVREQTAPVVARPRMEELREIYGDTR